MALFHGEIHVSNELLLAFFKNGEHREFKVLEGVPPDAIVTEVVPHNTESGVSVIGFDTDTECSALVMPVVTTHR